MSRSRHPKHRRSPYAACAKRIESRRYRAKTRTVLASGRADELTSNVRASMRWDVWSWD